MTVAAVLIPTLRRPESLERALRSVFAQDGLRTLVAEIVVVDNAPEGSAAPVVERLRPASPTPLRYVHAPRPGVATARNAGLATVTADHVVFIDDDETAPPAWLGRLLGAHLRLGADVTFGPVHGRAPGAPAHVRGAVERFFSRLRDDPTGLLPDTAGCGCGNSAMRRATALAGPGPFDTAADAIGGEDDRLFTRLHAQGARFAWAADAALWEEVPPDRTAPRYVLARAMARGQGPTRIALRRTPPARLEAAGWMAVGAAQLLGYGVAAMVGRALRRPGWLGVANRAAGGLGKLVWWPDLAFYGAGVGAAPARPAAPPSRAGRDGRAAALARLDG